MLIVDKETQERILSFNKYAQFISEKFGITVCFDGLKAHTDGKTITLPNIAGMNKDETDFLYCVLLHEVGHIRYSTFTKEAFAKIKTNNHFELANSIEDARIENLLIGDFDGAHGIFEDLYNKFASDKKFMERIFKFSLDKVDDYKALCLYVHYSILNLKNKITLEEIVGNQQAKKTKAFVSKNNIDKIISKNPLKDWNDVIKLTDKIYDIFFGSKKDKSGKNDIEETQKSIDDALNQDLKDIEDRTSQFRDKIHSLSSEVKEAKNELEKLKSERAPVLKQLQEQLEKISKQRDLVEQALDCKDYLDSQKYRSNSFNTKVETKKETVKNIEEKLNELKSSNPLDEKVQSKISKLEERLKNQTDVLQNHQKKVDDCLGETKRTEDDLAKLPQELQQMPTGDLKKSLEELCNKENEIYDEIDKVKDAVDKVNGLFKALTEKLRTEKAEYSKKVSKALKEIQESMNEAGIPIEIVPSFQPTPGWEEADSVQMSFDEQASQESGEIVTNGTTFSGTNQRDILTMVDKAKEDLQQINVAELFQAKNKVSLLDSFNDFSKVNNTEEYITKAGDFFTSKRHLPLTTQFDVIKNQTSSNGTEIAAIKVKNSETIKKIKSIFRMKLKSNRKDRFKGNQEEGGLDQRSLWKLATRTDDNYFEINMPKHVNSVVASVAIDLSGSMDKDSTQHGKRLKELALFLSEGLTECYVNHEVIGYHAPINHDMRSTVKGNSYNRTANSLETVVFRNFKDRTNSGIQNIKINCTDNSDGESLKIVANRLTRERSKRKIMFVITDGRPFLSDSDLAVLDQDLKNTLAWCSKSKVEVFALGFNEDGKKFYGDRFCHIEKYEDLLDFLWKKLS